MPEYRELQPQSWQSWSRKSKQNPATKSSCLPDFYESEAAGNGITIQFKDYQDISYKYAPVIIYKEAFETRPIDEKYLPATVVKTADLTWDKIENKPFSSKFDKGNTVVTTTTYAYDNQLSFYISSYENILVDHEYYVITAKSATTDTL